MCFISTMWAEFCVIPLEAPEPILSGSDERGNSELSPSAGQTLLDAAGIFHTWQTISQKAVCYFATTPTQTINNVKLGRHRRAERRSEARWAAVRADGRAWASIEGRTFQIHLAGPGLTNRSTWQISPPFLLICKLSSLWISSPELPVQYLQHSDGSL